MPDFWVMIRGAWYQILFGTLGTNLGANRIRISQSWFPGAGAVWERIFATVPWPPRQSDIEWSVRINWAMHGYALRYALEIPSLTIWGSWCFPFQWRVHQTWWVMVAVVGMSMCQCVQRWSFSTLGMWQSLNPRVSGPAKWYLICDNHLLLDQFFFQETVGGSCLRTLNISTARVVPCLAQADAGAHVQISPSGAQDVRHRNLYNQLTES